MWPFCAVPFCSVLPLATPFAVPFAKPLPLAAAAAAAAAALACANSDVVRRKAIKTV